MGVLQRNPYQDTLLSFITMKPIPLNSKCWPEFTPQKGGDFYQNILQIEAKWIYRLKNTCPLGLNEALLQPCYFQCTAGICPPPCLPSRCLSLSVYASGRRSTTPPIWQVVHTEWIPYGVCTTALVPTPHWQITGKMSPLPTPLEFCPSLSPFSLPSPLSSLASSLPFSSSLFT